MKHIRDVYLDYSATTPLDKRVLDAMMPYLTDVYGNTSSTHRHGRKAEDAVEMARQKIAKIFNCKPSEIIFTSGGTESDNLAIRGSAWYAQKMGMGKNHLITTPVEHSAVGRTIGQLADFLGFTSTILPVDEYAMVDVEEFANACTDKTIIASVIYSNNEVGTIAPLPKLAEQARERGVLLHTDAVQAAGQLSLDVEVLGVDMMSISAHKFYGPKGVGALYLREGVNIIPSNTGGSHEEGHRPGTLNTAGIVGMAEALALAYEEQAYHLGHYRKLRDMLVDGILSRIPDSRLTGHPQERLPSHASFVFADIETNQLLMHLDMKGISASGASACKTGNPEPSSVLLAMGFSRAEAGGSLRLTVGRYTTEEDVAYAIDTLVEVVEKLRKLRRANEVHAK
ncbi:MAG: cysteine desulfurase NifS [Phototrophicales bacterium]|nr:MAG: cysteine desulfurase NifS [Phototrophicales bacterium]